MKRFALIGLLLFLWQISYSIFNLNFAIIPSPSQIGVAFLQLIGSGEAFSNILVSLQRVLVGFLLAAMIGVSAALFLGSYKKAGFFVEPLIEILRPIPPIAWIPIAILLFGLGNTPAYFIVFMGSFFPIFTNTLFGAHSIPKVYKNLSKTLELKKSVYFKDILFKYSLPYIFTGLKIGIGMAWMSVIAAELIGAQSGLGYFIQASRLLLQTDQVIVGMILIGLTGYALHWLLTVIEKRVIPWKAEKDVEN